MTMTVIKRNIRFLDLRVKMTVIRLYQYSNYPQDCNSSGEFRADFGSLNELCGHYLAIVGNQVSIASRQGVPFHNWQ